MMPQALGAALLGVSLGAVASAVIGYPFALADHAIAGIGGVAIALALVLPSGRRR